MKILVAEDDFTSRLVIQKMLSEFGDVHVAVDGLEAVDAYNASMSAGVPYDLICLDIMMPNMDGLEVLRQIRGREEEEGIQGPNGVKILMTTALGDPHNVTKAYWEYCNGYLVKPVEREKLLAQLREFGLVEGPS